MSLRLRLVLLILTLVTLVTVALSALQLQTLVDSLSAETIDRADDTAGQVSAFLIERIDKAAAEFPAPADLAGTKMLWNDLVSSDPDVAQYLLRTMAISPSLIEINIANETLRILVSSSPPNVGFAMRPHESFAEWTEKPLYRRAIELLSGRRPDWEVTLPMGIAGQAEPVFTVQVVTSSVLVQERLVQEMERLARVSAGALFASLVLILVATHTILRPLQRLEQTIDRIAAGQFQAEESDGPVAKEFRTVQSKLNMLGQQLHGQKAGAPLSPQDMRQNMDVLVERMASQLDVATRLAAISRLTGGVAHEIKNPLNAILLRLELLRTKLGDDDPDSRGEIDILSREVLRLDRVVKTFLDFSRPVEVHLELMDLSALAREVAVFIEPQAKASKLEASYQVPSEPAWIRGDSDLLQQAVLNLVTNAMEAMRDALAQEKMTPPARLRLTLHSEGEKHILEVADNGPGIPQELLEKVFQLYFTTKQHGSGIGLAMTYRAVQLHNGTISFSTEAGRGTVFRLELPSTVEDDG